MNCRKLLSAIFLLTLVWMGQVEAAPRGDVFQFGLKGGITFNQISKNEAGYISESMTSYTGFVAGTAFSFRLPVRGLTIQPELNYFSKGASIKTESTLRLRMDYIEMPVNLQWGLDLVLLRPFLMISPYVGCSVFKTPEEVSWKAFNRFEYGIGVGGGIDFWRIQLQIKYNWNLGPLIRKSRKNETSIYPSVLHDINKANFRGLDVSLTFFF